MHAMEGCCHPTRETRVSEEREGDGSCSLPRNESSYDNCNLIHLSDGRARGALPGDAPASDASILGN